MKVAYIDTSCLVSVAFGERGASKLAREISRFDELISSNLLESELRSVFAREKVTFSEDLLSWVSWVLPGRSLGSEFRAVLKAGYLRGADLWHVACALYVAPDPAEVAFLTLDDKQRDVALALGFGGN